jgi:anti-sigma B factor antagonist
MSCKITISAKGPTPVVQIQGKLIRKDVSRLSIILTQQLTSQSGKIIIDMNATEFIDSYAIGAIIKAWQALKERHCDLVICTNHPLIRSLLKSTRLDTAFRVVDTIDEPVMPGQ